MAPSRTSDSSRHSLANSFFATKGRSVGVSARLYFNKLIYGLIRSTRRTPHGGWLHTRWHWHRFPFSMRNSILWSPFLRAWFSPADESAIECMLRQPDYEPMAWVSPKSGDVFLDVGAYIGPYAILAAKALGPTGRVLALEPDIKNRRQLETNLALNGITNCTVISLAAWSSVGQIGWCQADQPDWHHASERTDANVTEATTLDELVKHHALDRVDWIKLDIEGGEVEALRGAQMILQRIRPTLFIEVHETSVPLRNLLLSFEYRIEKEFFDLPPDRHGWFLAKPI